MLGAARAPDGGGGKFFDFCADSSKATMVPTVVTSAVPRSVDFGVGGIGPFGAGGGGTGQPPGGIVAGHSWRCWSVPMAARHS